MFTPSHWGSPLMRLLSVLSLPGAEQLFGAERATERAERTRETHQGQHSLDELVGVQWTRPGQLRGHHHWAGSAATACDRPTGCRRGLTKGATARFASERPAATSPACPMPMVLCGCCCLKADRFDRRLRARLAARAERDGHPGLQQHRCPQVRLTFPCGAQNCD